MSKKDKHGVLQKLLVVSNAKNTQYFFLVANAKINAQGQLELNGLFVGLRREWQQQQQQQEEQNCTDVF